jgi:hypothetical protein
MPEMKEFTFSGKFAKTEDPGLRRLFGPCVPIEAVDAVIRAEDHKTFGEVRAEIRAMAKVWDPAAVHLARLKASRDYITASIEEAERRLSISDAEERTWFIQSFIDAAEVLDAAAQDVSNCLQEDDL